MKTKLLSIVALAVSHFRATGVISFDLPDLAALSLPLRTATLAMLGFAAAFAVSVLLHLTLDWWLGAVGAAIASLSRDAANGLVAAVYARRALRRLDAGGRMNHPPAPQPDLVQGPEGGLMPT